MGLETILQHEGFELAWEFSAEFLHLVFRHPNLGEEALGLCLDTQERMDFLDIVREAQRLLAPPPDHRCRLGALSGQPARIRLAVGPGARLNLEAVQAGRQLFEADLDARSSLRALVHVLTQESSQRSLIVRGRPQLFEDGGLRVGGHSGKWDPLLSHVVGPSGEWLPLKALLSSQEVTGWLNAQEVWERVGFARVSPVAWARLVDRGIYSQAEIALGGGENPAELALGRAYLAVQRGPLLEALPHLQEARQLVSGLSEDDQNLLLELETYLLCQQGTAQVDPIVRNMQQLVARQLPADRWAGRRALSNWRVFLDLIYEGQIPEAQLQVWQGWLAQLGAPVDEFTLSFARPQGAKRPQRPSEVVERPPLPPERSLAAPLLAIALALVLGFWWRYTHPIDWGPPAPLKPAATPR
ncbi:hypothetical protein JST97_30225 [bacterium]|nr:hypothetical protein [bacterium]